MDDLISRNKKATYRDRQPTFAPDHSTCDDTPFRLAVMGFHSSVISLIFSTSSPIHGIEEWLKMDYYGSLQQLHRIHRFWLDVNDLGEKPAENDWRHTFTCPHGCRR